MDKVNTFSSKMLKMEDVLVPRGYKIKEEKESSEDTPEVIKEVKGDKKKKKGSKEGPKTVPPFFTKQVVTIIGLKRTTSRFLPVSHEGYSNETYVDKVSILGKQRAEFIARKLKGIERRSHMGLFRELLELTENKKNTNNEKQSEENNKQKTWDEIFQTKFKKACYIPDTLCMACWNCSLFGGLRAEKGESFGTFSRIRYFDTYSIEDSMDCIATLESDEGLAIGNQVYEDLSEPRDSASYHLYEYVKPDTHFPLITIIESPTLLDVIGYIHTVRRANQHGYGKYSANHGKFDTEFLAVSTGYPRFSVLDMIHWADTEGVNGLKSRFIETSTNKVYFDDCKDVVTIYGNEEINKLSEKLGEEFGKYFNALSPKS